ncbi:hypothetical protein DFO83_11013 [Idiomarina loihiensis]|uniref:Uncharacterized protein n=1 Tax=Idiomarina abyssalis TaxID=86102 RepID=A0A8I1KGV6_9GAMM|nr:hypothetical protein [Idiomarina]MAD53395.1 hypothetical protein [Idiomarinaceae bacterium]MBJ7267656.1 hypothetical protein [Idiomarina abyssalis]MBJ7272413.1 hypothetical protein [Idiomarina abyssalis]MBJ7315347.1 hypothetical protein [Idiomarina abyssalis]PWW34852.1 hypothetical protein DFO83_11013 [Idiomarina loihiensis]|tara:strand:+ start:2368 stop:2769 length:402 start_codon:yes stop_codon:yes gene_type:complete
MKLLLIIIALLMTNACAAENQALCDTEDRYEAASHFSDFVQKVNFKYALEDIEGLNNEQIIEQVARTDEDYRAILNNFNVKSYFEDDNVVMLMCEGDSLIIEDAGCTAKVEKVFECGERPACALSTNAFKVCN